MINGAFFFVTCARLPSTRFVNPLHTTTDVERNFRQGGFILCNHQCPYLSTFYSYSLSNYHLRSITHKRHVKEEKTYKLCEVVCTAPLFIRQSRYDFPSSLQILLCAFYIVFTYIIPKIKASYLLLLLCKYIHTPIDGFIGVYKDTGTSVNVFLGPPSSTSHPPLSTPDLYEYVCFFTFYVPGVVRQQSVPTVLKFSNSKRMLKDMANFLGKMLPVNSKYINFSIKIPFFIFTIILVSVRIHCCSLGKGFSLFSEVEDLT